MRKRIPSALRKAVWNHYNGKVYETTCYTGCGETISVHNFECGHVIAVSCNGETDLSNLRPICSNCNKSMGNKNMEEFINKYGFKKDNSDENEKSNDKIKNKPIQHQCDKCQETFNKRYLLIRHQNRLTDCVTGSKTNKKITKFGCRFCKKKFNR